MKSVTKAVSERFSARKFTNKDVSSELLKKLILQASQSPSGGNLQPWRIYVINKNGMKKGYSVSIKRDTGVVEYYFPPSIPVTATVRETIDSYVKAEVFKGVCEKIKRKKL